MLYFLDLLGTLAFAITGAYRAKITKFHILSVIFLGAITAVGGGTIRDLIIKRTPFFYLKDPSYLTICVIGGVLIYFMPSFFKRGYSFFRFMDSVGLSAFLIIGVSVSFSHLFPEGELSLTSFFASVFLGILTGFGGGLIRDLIMGGIPLLFKNGSNYVLSAFLGASSFYLLAFFNIQLAMAVSILITLAMREVLSKYGIYRRLTLFFKKDKKKISI